MSMTKGTPASSQIITLERLLAEATARAQKAEAERDAARGELANWKLGSDMADWSALPRDLYVTNARAIDHIGWQVTLCSVPMAIGPEVRYVRADALARAEAERDEARALYEAADKQLGLHLNGTVHEALQDLVRDADARAATARNRALEEAAEPATYRRPAMVEWINRFSGKPEPGGFERFGRPAGYKCDDCGTECICDCMVCGAPNCCPRCCAEADREEREATDGK